MEAQRVVVIQDASREVSSSAMKWALHGFSLKPGDVLTLLGVLRQVHTPMGYRSRIDSTMFGANKRIVDREVATKKHEYENHAELVQISKLYKTRKVEFKMEVAAGPSPKAVALRRAQDLKATWVILDRQMKKDRKYFLEKLSCGISRMKRNNSIEQLRGQKKLAEADLHLKEKQVRSSRLTYDEMVPGSPEEHEMVPGSPEEQELFSIELFRPCPKEAYQLSQVEELTEEGSTKEETLDDCQPEEIFQNSMCNICKNRRPDSRWNRDFTFAELYAATDGFSTKNTLYEGGIGPSACRGQLKNNLKIVVKQHKSEGHQGETNFKAEVHSLKKARHKNVLMLLGSCTELSVMLLVYEYACNGSVNRHISKHCPLPLTWTERMKVALGSSRGLNYLHENNMVHGNLRTSNIVLTHDFEPMLGDFGLSTEHPSDCEDLENGYIAPEYQESRQLSAWTDVYAFGIVLLELITGRSAAEKIAGGKGLVKWVIPLLKDRRHLEIVDPRIANSHDSEQLYWMGRVIQKCLSKNSRKRLTMNEVVTALESITERKSCQLIQDLSAAKSFFYSALEFSVSRRYEKSFGRDSFSRERDDENRASRSNSFTSASFSRNSTSSEKSDKVRETSANRMSLSYAEMLN